MHSLSNNSTHEKIHVRADYGGRRALRSRNEIEFLSCDDIARGTYNKSRGHISGCLTTIGGQIGDGMHGRVVLSLLATKRRLTRSDKKSAVVYWSIGYK